MRREKLGGPEQSCGKELSKKRKADEDSHMGEGCRRERTHPSGFLIIKVSLANMSQVYQTVTQHVYT